MLRDLPRLGPRISNDESIFMNGTPGNDNDNHDVSHHNGLDPLDDVFGSAPSSPMLTGDDGVHRRGAERAEHSDIPRLRSIHVTNGYREGIAVSKEQYIQAGFDEGYSLGGEIGTKAGWCLGVLEGMCAAARKAQKGNRGGQDHEAPWGRLQAIYNEAQEELKMNKLFSSEHFGSDGIWLYDVPGQDASEEELQVTFKDVAAAHPLINKWSERIVSLTKEYGLHLH